MFWGVVDKDSCDLFGQAEEPFFGLTDTAAFSLDESGWRVTLDCTAGLDRALDAYEGFRLSPGFHKSIWPGETGLDNVTGVDDPVWWGLRPPAGTLVSGGGSGFVGRRLTPTVVNRL